MHYNSLYKPYIVCYPYTNLMLTLYCPYSDLILAF